MMYTVRHRHTGAPRPPLDLRLQPERVSAHGLLDAKALMDANAARVERSIAPPETKPYLDETLVPGYMVPTENRARAAPPRRSASRLSSGRVLGASSSPRRSGRGRCARPRPASLGWRSK